MIKKLVLAAACFFSAPMTASATVIDFEDAYSSLGYLGQPTTYYQASAGVRFEGGYFGLIGGNGNGDPGNFDSEGTNGSSSLAVNTIGHVIDMVFDSTFSSLVLDLGVSFSRTSNVTVQTYNNNILMDTSVVSFTDTLNNGAGTWYEQSWSNRDRVVLTASGGWRAWSIDNLRINEGVAPVPIPAAGFLLAGALGGLGLMRRRKKF